MVDEAQRLNGDCIELLRHLHDHPDTRFALLYVGGNGCWEVLSREPMLRSRVFRRLPFQPLTRERAYELMRTFHPIYAQAPDALLLDVDDTFAHGTLRDWASFTHTAAMLCAEPKQHHQDPLWWPEARLRCHVAGGGRLPQPSTEEAAQPGFPGRALG